TLSITTSNCAPAPSLTFSLDPNSCSPRVLSYIGSRPDNITWYWQTSNTGTSMTNSTSSIQVVSPGTYYVRPYNTQYGCWGTVSASYAVASVSNPPNVPEAPIII